ncbi:MAG TPA: PQQ-dependent sugar dehydrogenase [Actinomycetes bacterium]|nr:PQQ-dependent sugar dehydrogenase [Actinomycetes bacterium]
MNNSTRGFSLRTTSLVTVLVIVLGTAVFASVASRNSVAAADPVPAGNYSLSLVASGVREPDTLRTAPDGRIFLLQQSGRVRIIAHGKLKTKAALKIPDSQIIALNNSSGLLSIAFPPGFRSAATQYVYLLYTHPPMAGYNYRHNVVSRWQINGDVIDPSSEQILVHLDPLVNSTGGFATSHYGGDMEFGPDGKLYVTTGDLYNATNGQLLSNRLGKVLRYNPDGSIPTSNPFYNSTTGENRAIWTYGFRNPFKLAKDTRTGDLVLGDVGSSKFEEVNVLSPDAGGSNYGWSLAEGYTTDPRFISPIYAYPHSGTGSEVYGCAVIGGDIYRPRTKTFPGIAGDFIFADHCQGWLRTIDPATGQLGPILVTGLSLPVDSAVARNGSIYIIERNVADGVPGAILRLDYAGTASTPVINSQPEPVTTAIGGSATFTVYASGAAPMNFQWYRNGGAISGATSSSYTLASAASSDDGASFTVRVSNSSGSVMSDGAMLDVIADSAPLPTITSPLAGATFAAGDVLHISGVATDAEDGALPASAFSWDVDLHHNTHVHDVVGPITGVKSLDVALSRTDETDPDVFYRVLLTVTDSSGFSTTTVRDVAPQLSTFTVASLPSPLAVDLDGVSTATPTTVTGVVGTTRTLNASAVSKGGTTWVFDSWLGGVTNEFRSFNTDANPQTYTAVFRPSGGSVGTGTGLSATYYSQPNFTSPVLSRIDRIIHFDWPTEPVPGAPKDNFSVRWTGQVQAQFSGTYTYSAHIDRDETLTITVGGQTIIDASGQAGTFTGTRQATAGQKYPIEISYSDGHGGAGLELSYGLTSATMAPIPGSQLYPQ